jgi:transcriptional regulator with XRE-family HTH domain
MDSDINYQDLSKAIQLASQQSCPPFLRKRFVQSVKEGQPLLAQDLQQQLRRGEARSPKPQPDRLFYETGRENPSAHWVLLGNRVKEIRLDCKITQIDMAKILGYRDKETQWRTEAGRRNLSLFELWAITCSLSDLHDGCMLFDLRMREFWGQGLNQEIDRLSTAPRREGWERIHGARTQVRLRQKLSEQLKSARILSGLTQQSVATRHNISLYTLTQLEAGRMEATVYLCWALSKVYEGYHYPSAVLNQALGRLLGTGLSQVVDDLLRTKTERSDSLLIAATA